MPVQSRSKEKRTCIPRNPVALEIQQVYIFSDNYFDPLFNNLEYLVIQLTVENSPSK